ANGCTSNGIFLNIGTPDASGTLHFLDTNGAGGHDLKKLIKIAYTATSPDTLFSVVSMDSARNLFVVWCLTSDAAHPSQRQVFVSAASAASGWESWTTPVQVSDGMTSTGDAVNVFPWIKAGGPGRADAVWYGSDKIVDPSSHHNQSWNVFMSQVVFPTNSSGAITGAAPSTTLVKVTPHPMHYDSICLAGTGCIQSQGNRNLADFFVVSIDRSGAAEIVYDDTSNGLVQPGFTPGNQQLVDLSHASGTSVAVAAPLLHYVTRWQMGNTLYFAAMQDTAANQPTFYAGKTQSVDLCSVSACFPHVLTHPEPGLGGTQESGTV